VLKNYAQAYSASRTSLNQKKKKKKRKQSDQVLNEVMQGFWKK
jgi:hypothetical protein